MLRVIYKSEIEESIPVKPKQPTRYDKSMAWMEQQQEADRIKAMEKYSERINGLNKKTR